MSEGLKRPEIYNHIRILIADKKNKTSIRNVIRLKYKLSSKTAAWYIREYERHENAKGVRNPFLETTDEEILRHYMKSTGAASTARVMMVTKYRVETLVEREIRAGNTELLRKRDNDNKSRIKPSEAKTMAKKFLRQFRGREMTRNELLDIACQNEACNRFSISEVKKLAEESGIKIKNYKN